VSKPWDKLIVALDLTDEKKIIGVVEALSASGVIFKIGLIAFSKFGPKIAEAVIKRGAKLFIDFKLYDIPDTMVETAKQLVYLGAWGFTVHIKAGKEALIRVKDEVAKTAKESKLPKPLILGVTELTSSQASLKQVLELAGQAKEAGLDGVIASAQEAKVIKETFAKALLVVTPGIRNPRDETADQKRVTTAKDAFLNGADYIVVGRPIISKDDYLKAAEEILSH